MPEAFKRPCSICRRWFYLDPRVGARQRACGKPECQAARRKKSQARWRANNPDYATAYRILQRSAQQPPPEALRAPAPLNQLPWDVLLPADPAKDQFRRELVDFLVLLALLLRRFAKDQFRAYATDSTRGSGALAPRPAKDQFRPGPY